MVLCISLHSYYTATKHEQLMCQAVDEGDDATVRHLLGETVKAFRKELEAYGTLKYNVHVMISQVREVTGKKL